ncbi:MAG: TIGR03617 family F420-dependent LLM class oxidoreductase [Alphaproteobacteria bacterium]|nr:TIGR03617 family F420-dependent LLM class oxidoreductase [Alphaproteobacteria bacterium]MCB9929917.1 TIGR03617 family F420-dependent LLM class oxidoreductase [Alphaproteobacteria bacterium]
MKVETLLPLGKTDPGLRAPEKALDLATLMEDARQVEALGYDTLVVEETKDDPYQVMALAAAATTTLGLGTSVAMAFPRAPAVTAMSAWSIQKLSQGRFTLGLGSQVRGHITRRFGLDYHPPGPWMRDYIGAVRAVWHTWQTGEPLAFESERYNLSLMVPLFDPGPIDHAPPPIHIAAVNAVMCRIAGECADGVRPHPVCTPRYIKEVMRPAIEAGAARSGRTTAGFAIAMKPLVAAARDEDALQAKIRDTRARIAFYASTPTYRRPFELHGYGELASEMATLSRAQRWEEMPGRVPDDLYNTFVTAGTYDTIAAQLRERYADCVTSIEFSVPVESEADAGALRELVQDLRRPA